MYKGEPIDIDVLKQNNSFKEQAKEEDFLFAYMRPLFNNLKMRM